MSDPAASVKSIISGKINVDSEEDNGTFDHNYTTRVGSADSLNSENNSSNDSNYNETKNSLYVTSPSLSRNSTTSCLSTTATKDGIEGRRIHRTGPNAYSNQIISNLVKNQKLHPMDTASNNGENGDNSVFKTPVDTPVNSPPLRPQTPSAETPSTQTPGSDRLNFSQSSLQTTDAQIDGERGQHVDFLADQPTLSLNAKLSLLNKD